MRRLISAGGGSSSTPVPTISDPERPTVPYIAGLSQPYNPPVPMVTPTYATNGAGTHPTVVDFEVVKGPGQKFGGHRYWLAFTEYASEYGGGYEHNGNPAAHGNENPYVYYSDDGFNWVWPSSTTNPVSWPGDMQPPSQASLNSFNADTELAYDAPSGRLYLFWAEALGSDPTAHRTWRSWSTNGVTWSAPERVTSVGLGAGDITTRQISLTLGADGKWRAWMCGYMTPEMWILHDGIAGAWTWIGPTTGLDLSGGRPWHSGVTRIGDIYYMLSCIGSSATAIVASTSRDGIVWNKGNSVLITRPGAWDNVRIYRPCLQAHPDGVHMRVWYGSDSTTIGWHCGYTVIPRSKWPTPPA